MARKKLKAIGSIVGAKSAKLLAVEALIGSADFPLEYDNPNFDPDYELAREADLYTVQSSVTN